MSDDFKGMNSEDNPEQYEPDSMDYTPLMILEEAKSDFVKEGENGPNACIVLWVKHDEGNYQTGFYNAGLSVSQMLSLLEVVKYKVLKIMHPEPPQDA